MQLYSDVSPSARRYRPLACTHCAYPQMDGQAELIRLAGHMPRYARLRFMIHDYVHIINFLLIIINVLHRELNPDTVTHSLY